MQVMMHHFVDFLHMSKTWVTMPLLLPQRLLSLLFTTSSLPRTSRVPLAASKRCGHLLPPSVHFPTTTSPALDPSFVASMMTTKPQRRSARIHERSISQGANKSIGGNEAVVKRSRRRRTSSEANNSFSDAAKQKRPTKRRATTGSAAGSNRNSKAKVSFSKAKDQSNNDPGCLPRTRQNQIESEYDANGEGFPIVIGIDEAGRGPLAGPVVAAAAICNFNVPGVTDSKKITNEADREALYEQLTSNSDVTWAVAVMDAQQIDKINILQATLEGMKAAAQALVDSTSLSYRVATEVSVNEKGCYVVTSSNASGASKGEPHFALVDGNRLPKEMPCPSESMVKGDSREFCIAAASILAKVSRDRLMHDYHVLYPDYNLAQHKGYPTKAHMQAVAQFGASPIHRRTFAPLKHMQFDADGKVLGEK